MPQKVVTDGCHEKMSRKDVTEEGSLFKARKKRRGVLCPRRRLTLG